ncbi:homoserine O- acetyltransferase [Phlyctochytrium planicorne]|nr:homoserine O- acetyltransferase [Phlyctochytrium planicorne]
MSNLVGLVNNQQIAHLETFVTESGQELKNVPVAYKTWGKLNNDGSNCMVICHALSGSADVEDWWGPLLGRGKAFDPEVFFIFCGNVFGSPYGSYSPVSIHSETKKLVGPSFPLMTIRDDVRAHKQILDSLGVKEIQYVIGGSMGGMQVLEWAFFGPDYAKHIVPIATAGRHSAWGISWGEPPNQGLAAARMSALLTYRSRNSFETRFGRNVMPKRDSKDSDKDGSNVFSAQSYLRYQGDKFIKRFDANCYIALTKKMDSHDISAGRGTYEQALQSIRQPTLIIGIETDGLFTISEQYELSEHIPNSEIIIIHSFEGHDGFLLEFEQMNKHLTTFIQSKTPNLARIHAATYSESNDFKTKASTFGEAEGPDALMW